jgi:CRP/FNR family cyclic AMP-dependent transcriptional regulator
MAMMTRKRINKPTPSFAAKTFLSIIDRGKKILTLKKNQILFSQGDPSDAVFYILEGKVKLTVVSLKGKEAVIAVLERGAFLGEACLTAQLVCMKTATSMGASRIVRIEKADMLRVLHEEPAFSELFMAYLLSRNIRIEEDLVDQLFNSSEKRLARVLLLLAHYGKESNKTELLTLKINQETLADMIGITQSKVSFFMNKFRKLGFIDNIGGLHVHSSLLKIVLQD